MALFERRGDATQACHRYPRFHHLCEREIMPAKLIRPWKATLAILAASTILSAATAMPSIAGDDKEQSPSTQTPIKHVVVIFGENESFDHYFGTYPFAENPKVQAFPEPRFVAGDDTPSADTLLTAGLLTNNRNLEPPYRLMRSEAYTCDMDHDYTDEQKAVDGGLMDKYVQATGDIGVGCRADGSTVMAYFDGNTVTGLWNYAQRFAMDDNSYDSMFGPSTPGAINLVSGQTGNAVIALTFSNGQIATTSPLVTITGDNDAALDDCGADKGGTKTGQGTLEITSGKNVGDLLNAKHVTWGWFQGGFLPTVPATPGSPAVCGSMHTQHQYTPPGASQPVLVVPNPTPINGGPAEIHVLGADYSSHHEPFQYYQSTRNPHHLRPTSTAMIGHTDQANHQYDITDFFNALKAGNLPAVSYLKAARYQDAHPSNSDPLLEQVFVVNVLNALQKSPFWQDTAVIISYDDSDGWYDHRLGPVVNNSTNNGTQDPSNPGIGGDNNTTNANDSFIPTLPLSTSTTPANADLITTSGVCGPSPVGAPPGAGRCGYGPRLPFIVISPWARSNFIDHTVTDQTSSLRFIEVNWNLGFIDGTTLPPGQTLGSFSFDQLAGSIFNMFDFDNQPNTRPLILDPLTGAAVKYQ
jgi:phospholipase C